MEGKDIDNKIRDKEERKNRIEFNSHESGQSRGERDGKEWNEEQSTLCNSNNTKVLEAVM